MPTTILDWLNREDRPGDMYEMLGRPRFDPDGAALRAAVRAANRELWPYQNHRRPEVAERARSLLAELGRAEDIIDDPSRMKNYLRYLIARLVRECLQEAGPDDPSWQGEEARGWLIDRMNIHPGRLDAFLALVRRHLAQRSDAAELSLPPHGVGIGAGGSGDEIYGFADSSRDEDLAGAPAELLPESMTLAAPPATEELALERAIRRPESPFGVQRGMLVRVVTAGLALGAILVALAVGNAPGPGPERSSWATRRVRRQPPAGLPDSLAKSDGREAATKSDARGAAPASNSSRAAEGTSQIPAEPAREAERPAPTPPRQEPSPRASEDRSPPPADRTGPRDDATRPLPTPQSLGVLLKNMRVYEGSNVEPEEFVIVSPKPIPQGRSFKLRSYNKDQKWLGDVPMEAGVGKALSDWYRENSAFFAVDDPLREALLTLRVRKEGDDDDPRYVPSIAKAQILVGRFVPDTRSPRGDLVYATLIVGETGLTKDIDNLPDWPSRLDRKYLALHDDRRMREIQLHMKRNRQKQDMARLDRNMGSMIRQGHIDAQREFEARRNFLRGHGWPL